MKIKLIPVVLYYIRVAVGQYDVTSIGIDTETNQIGNIFYQAGVAQGINNPEKYPNESFPMKFNAIYQEYVSSNDESINYENWLIMNKFGILEDTQDSEKKVNEHERANEINKYINETEQGNTLTTRGKKKKKTDKGIDNVTTKKGKYKVYQMGVEQGIINPQKYPFGTFLIDEPTFNLIYNEYLHLTDHPMSYKKWLIKNNFSLLRDTHLSLVAKAIKGVKLARNRDSFINVVRQGDILLTNGKNNNGLIGQAAIMATNNFVLEMPGYKLNKTRKYNRGKSNNKRVIKDIWFERHKRHWITVYRYPDLAVAGAAARWAYRNYYNPTYGSTKTIHITYQITMNFLSKNPSYCSKLVLHAYYFGTDAIVRQKLLKYQLVFPTELYKYFRKSLINVGTY